MNDDERKEAKDAISNLIQESLKEAETSIAKKNNYQIVSDSLSNLEKLQDINHKRNANKAVWISVVIAGMGLFLSIAMSLGGTRLTMQDFFNDVKYLQQKVKKIELKLDVVEEENAKINVYKYKIDKLQEDFEIFVRNHKQ